MRARRLAVAAIGAVVVAGSIGVARVVAVSSRPARIAFCVRHGAPSDPTSTGGWSETHFAAVAQSLTAEQQSRLSTILGESTVRWEARANPLDVDLGDGDPDAELTAWMKQGPVSVLVASTSARGTVCAVDGFCVRVRPVDGCASGWSEPPDDAARERARFLLWPYGYALVVEAGSVGAARTVAARFREAARVAGSTIGLVITTMDVEDAKGTRLDEEWRRHEKWRRIATSSTGGDGGEGDEGSPLFPVPLGAREVLLLPELSAIGKRDAFVRDVARLDEGGSVRWAAE